MAKHRVTGILKSCVFAGGLALLLLGTWGLAWSAEQPAPRVVTKKLPAPPPALDQPAPSVEAAPAAGGQTAPQAPPPAAPSAAEASVGQAGPKMLKIPAPPPAPGADQAGQAMEKVTPPGASAAAPAAPAPPAATGSRLPTHISAEVAMLYNPKGKIDPFLPLFREEPARVQTESAAGKTKKSKIKKRIPRTPLERLDLSQLKLAAIIMVPSGNKALVEEASGKGYIIKKGMYIGRDSGVVTAIVKDRVIVREQVEDALGRVVVRNSEMKLQRPAGE